MPITQGWATFTWIACALLEELCNSLETLAREWKHVLTLLHQSDLSQPHRRPWSIHYHFLQG